jgi:hypothetical protein
MVFLGLPTTAVAQDITGELTVESFVTGREGEVPAITAGDAFSYTVNVQCSDPDTGACANTVLTFALPSPLVYADSGFTISPAVATGSITDGKLTVTFNDGKLNAGQLVAITVKAKLPSSASANLDGNTIKADVRVTSDSADTVTDSVSVKLNIPAVLHAATTISSDPTSSQPALPGRPVNYTITGDNTSNVSVESVQLALPTTVGSANPFDTLAVTDITSLAAPSDADRVQLDWYDGSQWQIGSPVAVPNDASDLLPATPSDIRGLRFIFTKNGGAVAPGDAARIVLHTAARTDAFDELNSGDSIVVTATASTTVRFAGDSATDEDSAALTFVKTAVSVTASTTFDGTSLVAGNSTTVTASATNGLMPVHQLRIDEPAAGDHPDLWSQGFTFAGFVTTGGGAVVSWPEGASSAEVTYQYTDGGSDTASTTSVDTLPAPAEGRTVRSFSVVFTGTGDAIISGARAVVPFRVTAGSVSVEAGVDATNTISATASAADDSGPNTSKTDTASDTITLLPQRVRAAATKEFSRSTLWAAAGSTMTVELTGAVAASSTVGSTYLSLTDTSAEFWDNFDLRRIVSTDIPAGSTLLVEYCTNACDDPDLADWATLASQAGPSSDWGFTPSTAGVEAASIAGLRFRFADSDGDLLPPGYNVAPRFEVKLRSTLRSDPSRSTNPTVTLAVTDTATAKVSNGLAIEPTAEASDQDSVTLYPSTTGTGGTGAPDLIRKYWVSDSTVDALSGDSKTTRINWDTDGLSMSTMTITDDPRGATNLAGSSYDAFDLVRIEPITTSIDPLIRYDRVSDVELYYDGGWHSVASQACPNASSCDGKFPGYTLTPAEQQSTHSARITFAPGSASTSGSVAISSSSSPSRGLQLTMRLRNTLRSDPSSYVLGTSHSYTYNSGEPGVVDNRADALGVLTTPTDTGVESYSDSYSADVTIYDRPLNLSLTKSLDQTALGLPQAATTEPGDYPLITATLTALNRTTSAVPELTISDPNPDAAGLGAYDYLNLYQVVPTTLPQGLSADDVTVDLSRYADGTVATTSGLPLAAVAAMTPPELADVVGITVHYGALANLDDPSAHLIGSEESAVLDLTFQLRSTQRSTGTATTPTQVTNTARARIVSPGGTSANVPEASDTAGVAIVQPTYSVVAGKSINPTSRFEDESSDYTVNLSGQPSGTARTKLLTVTDDTPTFWNAFDLDSIPAIAVPTPVNQLRLSVLTGVGWTVDAGSQALSYTCNGGSDLTDCWHAADWTAAVDGTVTLNLPAGIAAADVRGVRVDARSVDADGTPVQWERPSSPKVQVGLSVTRRTYLVYGTDGGSTTLVPTTRPDLAKAPGESVLGRITNQVTAEATAGWLNNASPYSATATSTATTTLQHRVNKIKVEKTPGKTSAAAAVPGYDLGETIPFQLKITNTGAWPMTGLRLTDQIGPVDTDAGLGATASGLVPADVSDVFTYTVDGLAVSGFAASLDQDTGELSLTVPSGFVLDPGAVLVITAKLQLRPLLSAGTVVSNTVSATSDRPFEQCVATEDGLDQAATSDVETCTAVNHVRAAASTPMTVTKSVKGVAAGDPAAAAGEANHDDLGVISVGSSTALADCATSPDGFYNAPCTPITRPGGTERWRLSMVNGGNVAANTISAIDVLPAVGDTGVTVGTARKSKFNPIFAGNIAVNVGGTSGYTVATYYATSVASPSCNKSDILADTNPNPVSNCGLTWHEFNNADFADPLGADAARAASVKAIKIVVSYADATDGIAPGGSLQATFDTITPNQTALADSNTVEPVAWNSAAVGSRTARVPATEITPAYEPRASLITEPRKVGVAIASGQLNLAKTVTVPDGAAWTGALPTSYSGTLQCTSLGEPVSLTGTATSLDTAAVSLPIVARVGTGATVNYNADGSSTLPLFASCSFDENAATGATGAATTVTAGRDYSAVANVSNGWHSDIPSLSVTNSYHRAGFTVSKAVTGPSAKDADGADVSFKDFTFTASCTLNGTEVLPSAQRSFSLRAGDTAVIDDLPAGADCTVTEDYAAAAAQTSASITTADGSSSYADGDRFTLVAGDPDQTELAYTNRYTVGAVTITKTVEDATGRWGNADFTARLVCTDDDTVDATVYDGTVILSKTAPTATITNLPTGASCTVTETATGGANAHAISGGSFTVGADPTQPAEVGITNTFTTGSVRVTGTIKANGTATTAEPWAGGTYPVTLSCTREVNGTTVPITIPDGELRNLTRAGSWQLTYSDLPTGASCAVTHRAADITLAASQPDPTITITDPVIVPGGGTATIGVTDNFPAGKLVISKALHGVGSSFFSTAKYSASCTLAGVTGIVFATGSDVSVTTPTLSSTELGPLPINSSCTVTETASGGADSTPAPQQVTITSSDSVTTTSFDNYFSAGTLTLTKALLGDASGAGWATNATFALAVKCAKNESGPFLYDGTVSLKGGQSTTLTDAGGAPILFPYGTHCWANETNSHGAVEVALANDSFTNGVQVTADPENLQTLSIGAANTFTYSGFTITKDVVTTGATDQSGGFLSYNPSLTFAASCQFDGATVLNDTFTLTGSTSSESGTTRWGSRTYDRLPTGATCTVTETGTGSATSTSFTVSRSGYTPVTTSPTTTATFTLVKGDPANATGDPAANVAAVTNTYEVGKAIIQKSVTGATSWATAPFTVNLTCTGAGFLDGTAYSKAFTFTYPDHLSETVDGLPVGASCTVDEPASGNGGANSTSYTNKTFTVVSGTTGTTATVTNNFTQGTVKATKAVRGGTQASSVDLSGYAPWKNSTFDLLVTCTRTVNGSPVSYQLTGTVSGTTTSGANTKSWAAQTGSTCAIAETGMAFPVNTPDQGAVTSVSSANVTVTATGTYNLSVTNYFGYGKAQISKTVDGEGATAFGGGKFSFALTCTLAGSGTVVNNTTFTAQRSSGNTFTSTASVPLAIGTQCSATETKSAGATSTSPTGAVVLDPITKDTTSVAAFTNTFQYAGFTVTKSVDNGDARDQAGLGIKYTGSYAFSASCTYDNGVSTTATALAATSFSLKDGESKTFVDLPVGAKCSVSETATANAKSTSYSVTQNGGNPTTGTGTTTSQFTLVRTVSDTKDPGATVIAFANHYSTGTLTVTKATDGAGAGIWDGGTFTVRASCTLSGATDNAGNAQVYNATKTLAKGQTWTIPQLPTGALCAVSEEKSAGANQTTVVPAAATIIDGGTTAVQVTNTFSTGVVRVQKALMVNGVTTTAEPWASARYPMTLACTKDFDDDGIAESLDIADATKTITGDGSVEWAGLPQGARCAATEGAISYPADTPQQPTLSSTTYSDPVTVTDGTTTTQTVTNEFGYGTVQVTKHLTGEAAERWGGAAYTFAVACTLAGTDGTVFEDPAVTIQRSGSETDLTSAQIGPIPQGAVCTVTETGTGWATSSTADAGADTASTGADESGRAHAVLLPVTASATRTAEFTNDFEFAGLTVTKSVHTDAVDQTDAPVSYTGSYGFSASCVIGGHEFLSAEQRSFTLTDGASKTITELPTGADCTVTETAALGASQTAVRTAQAGHEPVQAAASTAALTLVAGEVSDNSVAFTNTYPTGGLDVVKQTTGAGADDWGTGLFSVRTVCTLDDDALSATPEKTVFDDSRSLSAGQTWEIRNLPTGAHCSVTEPAAGGANGTTIDLPTPTIGTTNQTVTLTNTFNVGSISVTKAITANGTNAAALKPWSVGSYPVTLSCTKDFNNDGSAEALDLDAVMGSGFATKTITGAGTATWAGLPQGASCTVTEGTSSVTGQPQPTATVGSAAITNGGLASLTLTNQFSAAKLVIHKDITGAGATAWGTGPFTYDVDCSLTGNGTVFSRAGVTLTPSAGQTSLDSATMGPIPFGAACTVTETDTAGATSAGAPVELTMVADAQTSDVNTASFTNRFDYAGFTVTKAVSSTARDSFGALIGYQAAAFSASCRFKGAEILTSASDLSFALAAGASKTFQNLPTGAVCTVTETNTRGAASTAVRVQTGSTDTSTAATTSTFTLVAGTASATTATFTNSYTTGSATIAKATAGAGKDLWGTGVFTVQLACTLANASNSTVYNKTQDLRAGESWTVPDLPTGASCTVTEPKTGGGTSKTISPSTFAVGTGTQAVAVTNTFTLGAVKVTKALTVNQTSTTSAPWAEGSYRVKLSCTRSYNGSTVAIDIPDDSYPVGDALDGVRTITGNGNVSYPNLPTGASCAATEVSSSPVAQSTAISAGVTVGNNPAVPQAITVTNDFHTRTMSIVKQLEGAGQASFGDGPFRFSVSCTLPVNGSPTSVFYAGGISLQRSGSQTSITSDAIGPIPVGATCEVTETDSGDADFTPDPVSITIGEDAAANLAGLTNQFSAGTITVTKTLAGAAATRSWATGATFDVDVVCQTDISGVRTQVFANTVQIVGGQTLAVTDGDGQPSRVPLGSHCWADETQSRGATSVSVDQHDWTSAAVVTAGTPQTLQALNLQVTNGYEYAGFTVTNQVIQGGAKDQDNGEVDHSGSFGYTAGCTLDGTTVLQESFSLARKADGSWEAKTFTGLPAGALCQVEQTGRAGASATSNTVIQNGTSGSPTATTSLSFTLVRGSWPWGADDAGVNVAAFTNSYGVGSLRLTKVVDGDGADAWGNTSFEARVACSADLDADPDTAASVVFDQSRAMSKTDPTWQIDNLVAGAQCSVTETAWGGASAHPTATSVVIGEGSVEDVTVTNTFGLGSIDVHKVFTVDGESPQPGWADQLQSGSATVEVSCARQVNGATVALTVPGQARRVLNAANGFATTYSGLPTGAECTVTEVASSPIATGTSFSPGATVVVPDESSASVEVTNDYQTGSLTITKQLSGEGADAWADAPSAFSVDCLMRDADSTTYPVFSAEDVTLSRSTGLVSAPLGPIPVGASCTVHETATGGASSPADDAEVTISGTDGDAVTMTNQFDLGTITAAVETTVDGQPSTALPFGGAKFSVELSCERNVNGSWQSITIPGSATAVITGNGTHDFTGLPQGARCTLSQTAASLTPQVLGYRTAQDSSAGPVTVSGAPATITAIDDFHTEPLVVHKLLSGSGADDFAVHPFTFSVDCSLQESGVADPWPVFSDDAVTLSAASGLTSANLGPIPVGSQCTVTETKSGGATLSSPAQGLSVLDGSANVVELTNTFDTGSVIVTKQIRVDGEPSTAEPYASGVYTVALSCRQDVDGESTEVTIPGGPTRRITGSGTARFDAVPLGASCALTESSSSLAVASDQVVIDNPSFTIGEEPVEVNVTNSFHTSSLRLVARFAGVGAANFATDLVAKVDCTLDGAEGSVFSSTVTLRPEAGEDTATSELLGPIPVGATCAVTTLSAHGANALPGTISVTGEPGQVAVAGVEADYSAGAVTVTKQLTGPGAAAAASKTFAIAVTCQRENVIVASGTLRITGAGSATLDDGDGQPLLLPAGTACWATETDSGGANAVSIDHDSLDSAVVVAASSPETVQQLAITVTNRFLADDRLAFTGTAMGWGLPALALLSIGLGTWLIRRRGRAA